MSLQSIGRGVVVMVGAAMIAAAPQARTETWTATASVKTAAGATATVPVQIVVNRALTAQETEAVMGALKSGGEPALRKALAKLPASGSVRIGQNAAVSSRLVLERPTDKGRLITIVTETPLLFLGASLPGAKPKEGYDFAVLDMEVDANGAGTGTLAPAAKIRLSGQSVTVADYGAEAVRLVDVKRAK
jgi:hypothetical protein